MTKKSIVDVVSLVSLPICQKKENGRKGELYLDHKYGGGRFMIRAVFFAHITQIIPHRNNLNH